MTPRPTRPDNETREAFYRAISYADSTYRERGRVTQPGWKTDRGRIYAKHGVADEMLRRQQQGTAPPYEVWRYSKGKGNYYIFADLTGVGGFKLMNSNDVKEVGDPELAADPRRAGARGHRPMAQPGPDRAGSGEQAFADRRRMMRVFESSPTRVEVTICNG